LTLFFIKLDCHCRLPLQQIYLNVFEARVEISNVLNFSESVTVLRPNFLKEARVLLHRILLLLYALLLRLEDAELSLFAIDLHVTLFVFLSQFRNVLVTGSHLLGVLV